MQVDDDNNSTSASQPRQGLPSPPNLGSKTIFTTPGADGVMRDVIIVECSKLNDQAFRGTISYTEARDKIFMEKLGLPADLLHSMKMNYGTTRSVSFKLSNQIDITMLKPHEKFSIQRSFMNGQNTQVNEIHCQILGIPSQAQLSPPTFSGGEEDVQWIEMSGSQYSVDELDLVKWLKQMKRLFME